MGFYSDRLLDQVEFLVIFNLSLYLVIHHHQHRQSANLQQHLSLFAFVDQRTEFEEGSIMKKNNKMKSLIAFSVAALCCCCCIMGRSK